MVALFFAAIAVTGVAAAAGGDTGNTEAWPKDPLIDNLKTLTDKGDWRGAAALMKDAVAKSPQKADYHNLYAYAVRKGPDPDMNLVFREYGEALRLEPKHRGAHEYVGEAYLMTGNLAKAREHLATLDRLCTFGCDEYSKLKAAVAAYEARKK